MATIAIYTFNSDIDTLPTFNSGFTYKYTDVDNNDGTITRTITSDVSPTSINFFNKTGLVSLSYLDTSQVTDMYSLFSYCTNLTSLDLSSFNTSNVTSMEYMFNNCNKLTSLDVSYLDTSQVTIMCDMFSYCTNLTSLDLSGFDTSNVIDMSWMFQHCSNLTSLDLSSFNTSSVTNMECMFEECKNISSLDLSSFNTSNVKNMISMFSNCSNLASLDLSDFDASKVINMFGLFSNCSNLISVNMKNSDVNSINKIISVLPTRTANATYDLIHGESISVTTPNSIKDIVFTYNNKTYDYNSFTQFTPGSSIYEVEGIDFIEINDNSYGGQNLFEIHCMIDIDGQLNGKSSGAMCYVYNRGTINIKAANSTDIDYTTANSKYWNITEEAKEAIMLFIGNTALSSMYLGNNQITGIYIGNTKIL